MAIGLILAAAGSVAVPGAAESQGGSTRGGAPLFFHVPEPALGPVSQRPIPELAPEQQEQLQIARGHLHQNRPEAARGVLNRLLVQHPHHAVVLAEVARMYEARSDWRGIEALARRERTAARDSLLLVREYVLALERLGKPREAADIALEAWLAGRQGPVTNWAGSAILRLSGSSPRNVRQRVREVASEHLDRTDLVRLSARLDAKAGDHASALRLLASSDRGGSGSPLLWSFADELLSTGNGADSLAALQALLDLAAEQRRDPGYRLPAARRAWMVLQSRGLGAEGAPRVVSALKDIPPRDWGGDFLLDVARTLRASGRTREARELIEHREGTEELPELALERALTELRDAPSERALAALRAGAELSDEGAFRYAEALFFAGQADSALVWYERATKDPSGPFAGSALERMFLIEDAEPREALRIFGQLAYEQWRGERKRALAIADSLVRSLRRGPLWAQAALALAAEHQADGRGELALPPLLAVADSLPEDRLAPLARQRAGDVYRTALEDDAKALQQYEECLARYPKAWNAPEVRRMVEMYRRERRF